MILRIGGVLGWLLLMLGSAHGAESDRVSVDAGVLLAATAADLAMGTIIHSCWVSFAKTGKPSCSGADPWPAYTQANDSWMVFTDRGGHIVPGLTAKQLDWQEGRVRWLIWLARIQSAWKRAFSWGN